MKESPSVCQLVCDWIVYGILLGSFVYAPFAYGCTPLWAMNGLAIWLGAASGLAVLKWIIVDRRLPRIPCIPAVILLFLNALGWFMVWNARCFYDARTVSFISLSNHLPWAPGAIDAERARLGMIMISALSAAFFVLCDMTANPVWRKRLLATIALTGAAIAALGIVVKMGGQPMMLYFWNADSAWDTNFALYRYHGNAASFLNMTWPVALAFFLARFAIKKDAPQCIGWGLCFVVILTGVMVNISKAGVAIATVMLAIFLFWRWRVHKMRSAQEKESSSKISPVVRRAYFGVGAVVVLAFVAFVAAMAATTNSGWSRWANISHERETSVETRFLTYQAASYMVRDAGWFGMGPTTFRITFPLYNGYVQDRIVGYWKHNHEDYMQALIEWGWIGGPLLGVFVFYGLGRGWRVFSQRSNFSGSEDRLLLFACCLALSGVAIHATFDFPFQIDSLRLYALGLLAVCWNSFHYALETDAAPPVLIRKKRKAKPED